MNSICPICGKEFDPRAGGTTRPRVTCSRECSIKRNARRAEARTQAVRDEARWEWARYEAMMLHHIAIESGVDALADCVYNRFNKRNRRR